MNIQYKLPTPVLISKTAYIPKENCWKQQQLKVKEVQKITKGYGAVLCFLDDGIGKNIEIGDLDIERWSYFKAGDPAGSHSTFGATTIAGKTLGIFPEMRLVSQQVLEPSSGLGSSKEIVSAIHAAKEMGIKTINLSLGSDRPDRNIEKALKYYCAGGVNVATIAAGNDGNNANTTDWPANYAKNINGVLSIAATQIDEQGNVSVAMFSSRGIVTLGAPGHMLKSMDQNNQTQLISGTSFAAPIVGATIAVARTLIGRDLYQDEILDIFKKHSEQLPKTVITDIGYGHLSILNFLNEVLKLKGTKAPKCYEPEKPKGICQKLKNILIMRTCK